MNIFNLNYRTNIYVRSLIYIVVIVGLTWVVAIYAKDIVPIIREKWILFVITSLFSLLAIINQAAGYKKLLLDYGKNIKFSRLLGVWAFSNLINYLGPFQPGILARSAVLKRHNIPLKVSAGASLQWLFISVMIGLFLFSLFLISLANPVLSIVGVTLCVSTAAWFVLGRRVVSFLLKQRCIQNRLGSNFLEGLAAASTLGSVHLFIIAQYGILVSVYLIIYKSFSSQVDLIDVVGMATLIPLSSLIAITPNGVGVIEGVTAYFAVQFQMSVQEGLFVALMTRVSHIVVCGFLVLWR